MRGYLVLAVLALSASAAPAQVVDARTLAERYARAYREYRALRAAGDVAAAEAKLEEFRRELRRWRIRAFTGGDAPVDPEVPIVDGDRKSVV